MSPLRGLRGLLSEKAQLPLGAGEVVDAARERERLADLGAEGKKARFLDQAVEAELARLHGLSALTSPLAMSYLDRISRPLTALEMGTAVQLTTRGYAAHVVIEERGGEIGIGEVPVIGSLPAMKRGRPPQDLLSRVVKISRRGFEDVRAVTYGTWEGFGVITARRAHATRGREADGTEAPALDVAIIDALLRFGWVLRQVDLYYHFAPERTPPGNDPEPPG